MVPGSSPLGVEVKGDREASCTWEGPATGGSRITVSLSLHEPAPGKTGPETAHAFFAAERTATRADEGDGLLGSAGPSGTWTGSARRPSATS
nr:hypothetical protein GCM10020093_095400 [Planobispora longispora]